MASKAAASVQPPSRSLSAVPVQRGSEGTVRQLVKASALMALGAKWHKSAWIGGDYSKNKEITEKLENETGFKSGTVFQKYDLYIRGAGPSKYVDIVKGLGKEHAKTFRSFLYDKTDFETLPDELQKLAVIICVSETGRGYNMFQLLTWMDQIVLGQAAWSDVKTSYAPSLTYKEDQFDKIGEYLPSDQESDEEESKYEPISDTEMEDLKKDT